MERIEYICPSCNQSFPDQTDIGNRINDEKIRGLEKAHQHFRVCYAKAESKELGKEKAYSTYITHTPYTCSICKAELIIFSVPSGYEKVDGRVGIPIKSNRGECANPCQAKGIECDMCVLFRPIKKEAKDIKYEYSEKTPF